MVESSLHVVHAVDRRRWLSLASSGVLSLSCAPAAVAQWQGKPPPASALRRKGPPCHIYLVGSDGECETELLISTDPDLIGLIRWKNGLLHATGGVPAAEVYDRGSGLLRFYAYAHEGVFHHDGGGPTSCLIEPSGEASEVYSEGVRCGSRQRSRGLML